jgi:hypothetical protein
MTIQLPAIKELKALPAEEQQAILQEFKGSAELLELQKRTNLFSRCFLIGLVIAVVALMILLARSGLLFCAAVSLGCWLIGIAIWMLLPALVVRRKLRHYVQRRSFGSS